MGLVGAIGSAMTVPEPAQSGKGNAVVLFTVEDPEAVREQAYQAAVENAKKKAQRLATLAGVKLGAVTSMTEGPAKGEDSSANVVRAIYGAVGASTDQTAVNTTILSESPVKMIVTVQFAIEK